MSGLPAGTPLPFGDVGLPGKLIMTSWAFPILTTPASNDVMGAAARVGAGRVVVFSKEDYVTRLEDEALMAGPIGLFFVNVVRWAAGNRTTIRVAGPPVDKGGDTTPAAMDFLKQAAAARGVTIAAPDPPCSDPSNPHVCTGAELLAASAGGARSADVFLGNAFVETYTSDGPSIRAFITAGGGFVTGGQAWYHAYSSPVADFPGNLLLAPLNVVQFTGSTADIPPAAFVVPGAPPGPLSRYNADVAGRQLADHLAGGDQLDPDALIAVVDLVSAAVRSSQVYGTPAEWPSSLTWRSFDGAVAKWALAAAASWQCSAVDGTQPTNKLAMNYLIKMNEELPTAESVALPCSGNFPGLGVNITADPGAVTVIVRASYPDQTQLQPFKRDDNWVSTGVYAAPGAPLSVTLPAAVAAQLTEERQIGVQIGCHTDALWNKDAWCRLPDGMTKRVWFSSATGGTLRVAAGTGGLVYIIVKRLAMFGDIQVSLSGGVRAPFFFSGQHTNADWNGGIKDHPAPWAEIGTHRLVVTVPSSYVREISDPQKIVDIYEAAMDAYADLAVYPPDRPNNERLVLDCDISFGWLHSGYPVMGYLEQAPDHLSTGIGDISEVERKWGMFHEFGHNHQIGSATPPHTGEVTCNLFSVYLAETVMKANRTGRQSLGETRASEVATYLASGTYQDDFEGVGLVLYMMLQENVAGPGNITGGWDYLKRLLLKYQDIEVTDPVTDADSAQRWIIESSREAGINLVDFYQQWKWPVAPETKAAVDALGLRALPAYMDAKKPCGAAPINFCQDCCLTGYA